jgi:hypothetical protein
VKKNINYKKLNDSVKKLINDGVITPYIGVAKKPVHVEIKIVNKHALKHGVTKEQAQGFINSAIIMFDQGNRSLYVSEDGNAVLLDYEKRLISAYKKDEFDPGIKAILEVAKNGI